MKYIEAFEKTAQRHQADVALVTEHDESLTYGELDKKATTLASFLNDQIKNGRLGTLLSNNDTAIISMLASMKRGRANIQLQTRLEKETLCDMISSTGMGALLFDDNNIKKAIEIIDTQDIPFGIHVGKKETGHEHVVDYGSLMSEEATRQAETIGDEYGIFYTSGTTSTPKAVLFDQKEMWLGSTQVIMEMGIDRRDRGLVISPWYHMVTNNAWILPHLQVGATLVLHSEFDPSNTLSAIAKHGITGLLAVPTQLDMLVEQQRNQQYDISPLQHIRTGGAVLTEELAEEISEQLTDQVYNTYGLTEGGANLTFSDPEMQRESPGTVGQASYMWEVRVVEATSPDEHPDPENTVDYGEIGEILARSPAMSEGYLNNPEQTDQLFVDGWLRPGDVAKIDKDGRIFVIDRIDNMIISGGKNIYPEEVESVLRKHNQVDDCAVLGIDDKRWGQKVVALIIADQNEITATELDRFCKQDSELADYKRPREYLITTTAIPRTDTGTIDRNKAKKIFDQRSPISV